MINCFLLSKQINFILILFSFLYIDRSVYYDVNLPFDQRLGMVYCIFRNMTLVWDLQFFLIFQLYSTGLTFGTSVIFVVINYITTSDNIRMGFDCIIAMMIAQLNPIN